MIERKDSSREAIKGWEDFSFKFTNALAEYAVKLGKKHRLASADHFLDALTNQNEKETTAGVVAMNAGRSSS